MLLNGKAPFPGQVIKLPNLAETFRLLAKEGPDGFYKGRIAQAVVDLVQAQGGLLTLEDMAAHRTDLVEPISLTYGKDIRVYEVSLYASLQVAAPSCTPVSSQWPRHHCPSGTGIIGVSTRRQADTAPR